MTRHLEPDAEPDAWLGGRLRLHQPPRGAHRAGTDAILLAHLLEAGHGETIVDLGAGTGAVGLACALRAPSCRVVLVELDAETAALAAANIRGNDLSERVRVVAADVLAPAAERRAAGLDANAADLVLTNPPFFEAARVRASPDAARAAAHTFPAEMAERGLERWLRTCADVLRPGGRLGLIHRAESLPACLDGLRGRFGAIALRPVHARAGRTAIRVLIGAVKGSRAPLRLEPALVLQGADGRFTPEIEAMHRGARVPG